MLRNRKYIFIVITLILSTIFTSCTYNFNKNDKVDISKSEYETLVIDDYNNIEVDNINQYQIDVVFNPEEKYYTAKQKVVYINNENIALKEIYFHIYPNAFKKESTVPFLFDSLKRAYPNGFKPGYIDIQKVSVDNKELDFSIIGEDKTILKIPLNSEILPKEKINICMEYKVVIPPARDRFGYGENTFNLGNWYPILAVYDDEGWNLDPYYSIGDPFYSEVSNYQVTIKAPKDIVIAASGLKISEKVIDNMKIWKFKAELMRDFAWVASKDFIEDEIKVNDTIVKLYFLNDNIEIQSFIRNVAFDCINIFNKIFGKYPYKQYSVVATSFPSGMEYPGIVFIGEEYYSDEYREFLETVIVHETAHQWWYGIVGNDEVDEAWLDESITSYSEVIYISEKYGDEIGEIYYHENTSNYYMSRKSILKMQDEVIVKPLSKFKGWEDYGPLVYSKGAMFINKIKEKYGKDVLYNILNEFFKRYRFKIASTSDFVNVCGDITGDDFTDLVNYWLYSKNAS